MVIISGFFFLILFAATACHATGKTNPTYVLKNVTFTSDLYHTIKNTTEANIVISPLSIQTAGALLFSGADGQTAEEIANGFKLSKYINEFLPTLLKYTKNPYVQIANKICVAKEIHLRQEFQKSASKNFLSKAEHVDFSRTNKLAKKINSWIRNVTSDKIDQVVDSKTFDSQTRLFLINAIHFKGGWKTPFEKKLTAQATFWINRNQYKKVSMMRTVHAFKYKRSAELNAQILEMDYNNTDISLMVILPKTRTGLSHLEDKLQSVDLIELSNDTKYRDVIVRLPKFKIEFTTDLNNVFTKMGMGTMFTDTADFSRMVEGEKIKVDKVMHKAFIEINEDGTEAAGVTTIAMSPIKLRPRRRFEANHSFLFAIKSKSEILFVGRYKG